MNTILLTFATMLMFLCGCAARNEGLQVHTPSAAQPIAVAAAAAPRPDGCFVFDRFGSQGWRVRGIFDGGDPSTQISTCGPIDMTAITTAVAGPAAPPRATSRLTPPPGPGCFPTSASSGVWASDFMSPDLENRPGWAGQNAFTLRINSVDARIIPSGLQVQALMRVLNPDGTES